MKRGNVLKVVFLLVVMIMFTYSVSYAQAGRGVGRLKGVVYFGMKGTDKAGGVTVTIEFEQSGGGKVLKYSMKTNKKGEWLFGKLGKGFWRVQAEAEGYIPDQKRIDVLQHSKNPKMILRLKKAKATEVSEEVNRMDQGNELYREAKYEDALAVYRELQAKDPNFHAIHISIANCLSGLEKFDEAIVELNTYIDKTKDQSDMLELKGKCLASIGEIHMKKGDMAKAQDFFIKSIELNPKDENLAYNVGAIFFGNNKNQEAIKYFEMAASIKPAWALPHLKLGYVHLNLGDMKKAVTCFEKFLEMDPENPQAEATKEVVKSLKGM
ncbi:MAG: tetratricopeptide repeat protein [bacterium]|nr:tetratricopeptide repeat protein [bacterium]